MSIFSTQTNTKEVGFILFSGLEYLKIDIANQAGKDKLNFEDRIKWFDQTIEDSIVTLSNEELKDYVYSFKDVDSHEGLFSSFLAYQDYWFNRPSGRMIGLDSVASGTQIMSCLTCNEFGLEQTGLLGNQRNDLYTTVYEKFKKLYGKPTDKTRADMKQAIMTHAYGSVAVPESVFTEEELPYFYLVMKQLLGSNESLKDTLIKIWNPNKDSYSWVEPDGFNIYSDVMVLKEETINVGVDIKLESYVKGTKQKSKELAANYIHAKDSLLVREMVRRTSFDVAHYQQVLYYLNQVPDNIYEPITKDNTDNSLLDKLLVNYQLAKFPTLAITDEIHSLADACKLPKELRIKFIDIISKLLVQGNIDFVCIHDQYQSHANNMNFIRYWYKEMCADLTESSVLTFGLSQLLGKIVPDPINPNRRKEIADRIRNSNYGLC